MKIVVRESAARDIDAIFAWIAKDNPRAAADMVERIRLRINRLAFPGLSHIGRPGLDEGTRELVEPPYIIVYDVHEAAGEIVVLAVLHGAQRVARNPEFCSASSGYARLARGGGDGSRFVGRVCGA